MIFRLVSFIVLAGSALLFAPGAAMEPSFRLDLIEIEGAIRPPVYLADPNDGTGRLFIVEQRGVIKIARDGVASTHPFLGIRDLVEDSGPEQGMLSLAFHPDFERNATFLVAYTEASNSIVIAKYTTAAGNPDRADPASQAVLLRIDKTYPEHNGGLLLFGPDGFLYISVGDGGQEAEPDGNGQRLDTLLGKMLRIDVDRPENGLAYGIPPDNPFVDEPGALPEIWAQGLRNPWRFSFDRLTGDLYISDVGAGEAEEVDFQPADSAGGDNYGWNVFEGRVCHRPNAGESCDGRGLIQPIWTYTHAETGGCAIIGGYVYRGTALPQLAGAYLAADVCTGIVWALRDQDGLWVATVLFRLDSVVSSFSEDASGELYLIGLRGHVYKLAPGNSSPRGAAISYDCFASASVPDGWECQRI